MFANCKSSRPLQTGPNLMLKVTAASSGAGAPSLTLPYPHSWAETVLPRPIETSAQSLKKRPRHQPRVFTSQSSRGSWGGTRESAREVGGGGGGSVRPVAAWEGEAFFLGKDWLPLAKEQKYLGIWKA